MRARRLIEVLLALVGTLSTGCIAMEMAYLHSTSIVAPPDRAPVPSPRTGSVVAVTVEDHRTGVASYEVGAKHNPGWGGYEASTVDLKDKASLADVVAEDTAGLLRQQGYRADVVRGVPGSAPDVLLTIRIDVFRVLVVPGLDIRVDGLFVLNVVNPSESQSRADAVGARFEFASSLYPSDSELQGCFDRLYATLRDKLRDRLRAALEELASPPPQ